MANFRSEFMEATLPRFEIKPRAGIAEWCVAETLVQVHLPGFLRSSHQRAIIEAAGAVAIQRNRYPILPKNEMRRSASKQAAGATAFTGEYG